MLHFGLDVCRCLHGQKEGSGMLDGKTIEVNGCDMYYVERGQGRPVVLVHGNTGSSRWWSRE